MSQFTCEICGQGFDQKSCFDRHMETSHPKPAPSAADVERVLSGIQYPKTKEEIVDYASQRITPEKELFSLIQSLPSRFYRDSAEVAIAIGELKGRHVRTAQEVARTEAPSTKAERLRLHQYLQLQLPRCFQE
jgi:hypothetical protein